MKIKLITIALLACGGAAVAQETNIDSEGLILVRKQADMHNAKEIYPKLESMRYLALAARCPNTKKAISVNCQAHVLEGKALVSANLDEGTGVCVWREAPELALPLKGEPRWELAPRPIRGHAATVHLLCGDLKP